MKADSAALRLVSYEPEEDVSRSARYPRLWVDLGGTEEDKQRRDTRYLTETIGRSQTCLLSQRMQVSDQLAVQVRMAMNIEFVADEKQETDEQGTEAMQILLQSRLLDAARPQLLANYRGKVVVFHDGDVLAVGETESEAVSRIPQAKRSLPAVVRRLCEGGEVEFMGGPKGF